MYVVWWSGRGYLTPIILIATLALFGLVLQAGRPMIADTLWYWGIAFVAAAVANWIVGVRVNHKKRRAARSTRLIYGARHRFMSIPMESFSIVLVLCGIGLIVTDLA
ncbi:MAG: hypothetical protein ACT4N8_08300, partial [Sphingosinicella sp.]|uniref:hypothetical protein n=1 Tax=Sphingosinicella sp. TaxID=1917971 RepID=UPI0040384E33